MALNYKENWQDVQVVEHSKQKQQLLERLPQSMLQSREKDFSLTPQDHFQKQKEVKGTGW